MAGYIGGHYGRQPKSKHEADVDLTLRPFDFCSPGSTRFDITFAQLVLKGERRMTVQASLLALCLLLCSEPPALSKGSAVHKEDPWDRRHIDDLPVDIRHYIAGICSGPPRAQHDFATYSPQERRWRINLEYLQCNGLGEYRRGNQCLDVDFVEEGLRFRLASKQYRDCGF